MSKKPLFDLDSYVANVSAAKFPISFPGHFIGGVWKDFPSSHALAWTVNPNNGAKTVQVHTDRSVLYAALDACDAAEEKLQGFSLDQRIELIRKIRTALSDYSTTMLDIMRMEGGKPLREARTDFDAAIQFMKHVEEQHQELIQGLNKNVAFGINSTDCVLLPIGTTVAYMPFSNPVNSFATYVCTALLAGCPIILTPSSHATLSGILLALLLERIDCPPGIVNLVFGDFETFRKVISDKRIQAIAYTGSRDHCELIIRESSGLKSRQLILQSGGKNAVIVHSSAELAKAVEMVVQSAYVAAGQLCSSASRVFVYKSLLKEFAERLSARITDFRVGLAYGPEKDAEQIEMGPLYSRKALEKFLRYQMMAHREAAANINWGKQLDPSNQSCLASPGAHIMRQFDAQSSYQSNVMFCPDIAIYEYEVLDDAIKMANTTDAPYCLGFCGDPDVLKARRTLIEAPNILVNTPTSDIENNAGLAGKYHCGHHRYQGANLLRLLTYPQMIRCN